MLPKTLLLAVVGLTSLVSAQGDVPSYLGFRYIGCWTDATAARAINGGVKTAISGTSFTIEACLTACNSPTSFSYAAMGLGNEVFLDVFQRGCNANKCSATAVIHIMRCRSK